MSRAFAHAPGRSSHFPVKLICKHESRSHLPRQTQRANGDPGTSTSYFGTVEGGVDPRVYAARATVYSQTSTRPTGVNLPKLTPSGAPRTIRTLPGPVGRAQRARRALCHLADRERTGCISLHRGKISVSTCADHKPGSGDEQEIARDSWRKESVHVGLMHNEPRALENMGRQQYVQGSPESHCERN